MNKLLIPGLVVLMFATGCASSTRTVRVAVPPRVDLKSYPTVGLVGFSSNEGNGLDRVSTARFLRALQAAQPGTRVVELGTEQQVLASVNARGWNRAALQAVKDEHGVDAVVIGRLDVERQKPGVSFSSLVKTVSVRQDVNAELTARIVETDDGATVWMDSAKCTANLANGNFSRGGGNVNVSDAEATYGEMVDGLVYRVTDAFRVHYVTRRVSVSDTAVASAE